MLGDGRAFDARRARPGPSGPSLQSVQNTPLPPVTPSSYSQSMNKSSHKSSAPKIPKSLPQLPGDFGAEFHAVFTCRLEARKLHVEVVPQVCPTASAVDRLVEASAEVACDAVVVSVPKQSPDFADWMRRLLYAGFTVLSKRDSWQPASPSAVACVLDLSDRSAASTSTASDDSVLTDDDSDESDSDDDWLDDDD